MPLTLEKYAELLDQRGEPRPAGPEPVAFANVKPHLPRLKTIRCVIYSGYGTLLLISGGELFFLNPDPIMRKIALDKTILEFKMWASMSRKPGEPAQYMATMFQQVWERLQITDTSKRDVEIRLDHVWEGVLARLNQKDYVYDVSLYGDAHEYAKKISYYYLMASQGVALFPDAAPALQSVRAAGLMQGIFACGQCPTPVQLLRLLIGQQPIRTLDEYFELPLCLWSYSLGYKKHSDRSVAALLKATAARGLAPDEVLVVGADVEQDIVPVKRKGFRTALLLADQASAKVKKEHLREERTRPDCLLTSLRQLTNVIQGV